MKIFFVDEMPFDKKKYKKWQQRKLAYLPKGTEIRIDGFYCTQSRSIFVLKSLPIMERYWVLIHELVHWVLHMIFGEKSNLHYIWDKYTGNKIRFVKIKK